MRKLIGPSLVVLMLSALFVACGGDDGTDSTTSPTASQTAAATATPTATPARTATVGPSQGVITPSPEPTPVDSLGDEKLYLSLGDSLGAGRGASDASRTSWVALVISGLGDGYELHNLAKAGDDSQELIDRQLQPAVDEITSRKNDAITGNETAAITLEIGGNDLLDLYDSLVLTGKCPSVEEALQKAECVDGLRGALDNYRPHLEETIDRLQAADPDVPIFLMTLYNPFSGSDGNLDRIGVLALEGEEGTPFAEGLNDTIRAVGEEKGAIIVEWYPIFIGKVDEYISQDIIHPNDTGHALMAQAVLDAMAQHRLP